MKIIKSLLTTERVKGTSAPLEDTHR